MNENDILDKIKFVKQKKKEFDSLCKEIDLKFSEKRISEFSPFFECRVGINSNFEKFLGLLRKQLCEIRDE